MEGVLPNFLIAGAVKSGTTSLARQLAEHPDAYVMPGKESHFFSLDEKWSLGVEWYRERFARHGGERAVGEATPTYLSSPHALARMASVVPDARLIVLLRNPVDRAYSHYWHWRIRLGRERREFAEAVDHELSAPAQDPAEDCGPAGRGAHYLADGLYLSQLLRVCEHYPRESLLVLLLDDLQNDPARTFASVCRHLEIDDSLVPPSVGVVANAHVEPRWERLWGLMYKRRLWRCIPTRLMPAAVRATTRRDVRYPPMDPGLRERLEAYFADANAALAEWLDRDLSSWGRAREASGNRS